MHSAAAPMADEQRIPRLVTRLGSRPLRLDARRGLPALADRRAHALGAAAPDRRHSARRGGPLSRALAVRRHRHRERLRSARAAKRVRPRSDACESAGDGPRARGFEAGIDLTRDEQRRILEFEASLDRPYHALLGVDRDADAKAIKRAYFALSQGVPPRPPLPARARRLRAAPRPDLQEDRRGLRAALGSGDPRRDRALAWPGAAAGRSGGRVRDGARRAAAAGRLRRRRCRRSAPPSSACAGTSASRRRCWPSGASRPSSSTRRR